MAQKRTLKGIYAISFTVGLMLASAAPAAEYLSPSDLALDADGKTLWITQHTGKRLDRFDPESKTVTRSIPLPDRPRGLAVSGVTAYIPTGEGQGWLHAVDLQSGKIPFSVPVGNGPMVPVLSPDGKTLYVCNRFGNSVSFIDLKARKTVRTVPVVREPVAAALTPDGSQLFVANHLPDGAANVDYIAAKVSVIDTQTGAAEHIKLVNGSEGLRGMCISADGQFVFATHLMARYQVPPTQLERGWVSTDALSVIRVADRKLLFTVLLDDADKGFANPWGVAVSPDNRLLAVTSAGNSELSLIDLDALSAKIVAAMKAAGASADAMHLKAHNDLSMLSGIRRRIPLEGIGARNLLMAGDRIYIAEYFSDSLGVVDVREGLQRSADSVLLGPKLPLTPERRGEIAFNDANLCFQNWLSCASCHPDARTDALNWDLLNDGIGNPKNVKNLFLAHQTPPVMSLGVRDRAETAVRTGFKFIQIAAVPEETAAAVDAYLRRLEQTPSPYLVGGKLSKPAKRGKKIFNSLSCIRCHPAPLYTDLKMHDVGTATGQDRGRPVDTPTLREIWRTAPYLHDGRFATIFELLQSDDHAGIQKELQSLTPQQIEELAEYILSL